MNTNPGGVFDIHQFVTHLQAIGPQVHVFVTHILANLPHTGVPRPTR
jgi:hypothetical protein